MGEEQSPFRFLTDEQFRRLAPKEKAAYLVRAQQELAEQQLTLREQLKDLMKQEKNRRA